MRHEGKSPALGCAKFIGASNYQQNPVTPVLGFAKRASAISYIQLKHADGKTRWGAGVDTNIELASVRAVLSALNRS